MDGYEISRVIRENLYCGPSKLLSYKKIIQRAVYPPFGEHLLLEIGKDLVDAYESNGGSLSDVVELTMFFLECGTHFASDFGGDMGEKYYETLEDTFEDLLKKLQSSDDRELFDNYSKRIEKMIEAADEAGWGYKDQLEYFWEKYFGED